MKFFLTEKLTRGTDLRVACRLFFLAIVVYLGTWLFVFSSGINSTLIPSEDTLPAVYLPLSLVRGEGFTLDFSADYLLSVYPNQDDKSAIPFYLRLIDGHYISGFPVITPLLAVPFYSFPVWVLQSSPESILIPILAKVAAAVIAAFSTLAMYLLLRVLLEKKPAVLLTLTYAFATSVFSISSQGLWQHGPTQLFLILALYMLVKGVESERLIPYAGLFFSLATLTRPTSVLIAVIMSLYVLFRHTRRVPGYALAALVPLLPWFWYNMAYFGSPLQHAYTTGVGTEGNWTGGIPEGFLGIWLSPSKGLLVYSPVFFISVVGIWLIWRRVGHSILGENTLLFRYISVAVIAFTFMMGRWYHWFGGWSFSYRMAVDVVPYLVVLMVPVLLRGLSRIQWKIVAVALVWSVLVQFTGVLFYDGEWHARFDDGPYDTAWLWSIQDAELVYYGKKVSCRVRSGSHEEYLACQGFLPVEAEILNSK